MLKIPNVLLAMSEVSFAQFFNRSKATPNNRMQSDQQTATRFADR